jgi:glycerophosphoryl diester phosphodiesterase
MIRTLHLMAKSLKYNLKTLIYFEILYRLLGVVLVYPFVSRLFYLTIDWSPFVYITNRDLLQYLISPTTILLLLLMVIIVVLYFLIEILFLQIIFEYGIKEITINLKYLWLAGYDQIKMMGKLLPIYLWIPTICFVYLTGFISVYGFASSIELPILVNELRADVWINRFVLGFTVLISIIFIETMLYLPIYTFKKQPFKAVKFEKKMMLNKRRIRTMLEFITINFLLNLVVYTLYVVIIIALGWLIQLTRGEGYVVPTLFTFIYAVYLLIGFISTLFFVPINVAYITAVYHNKHSEIITPETLDFYIMKPYPKQTKWTRKVAIFTTLVLIGLNIGTVYQILGADRSPLELLNRSAVIAHRGASIYAPENTLAAMDLAIAQGADAVEIDVRMSKDGIPFLFHDYTVNRTTHLKTGQSIENLTFEEIQNLDAGSWFHPDFAGEKIPSLAQVLELIYGRTYLYLEIKGSTPGIETRVMEMLIDYDMAASTTIMSFNREQLRKVKSMDEQISTMLLIPVFVGSLNGVITLDYVDSFGLRFDMIKSNPEYIEMIHKSGKRAYVWTLNRSSDIKYAVNIDVDGIITDDPLLAIELVYEKVTPTLLQDLIRRLFPKAT